MSSYKPKKILSKIIVGCIAFSFMAYPFFQAQADTSPDRALKEVDRPVREEVEEKLRFKPEEIIEDEEKEPDELEGGAAFFVKKIDLLGCESYPPEEFAEVLAKYEGKEISIERLNILAKRLEREYLKRGIISACFIPPQDVKEGVVKLQVVEAHMGELEIPDHAFFENDMLRNYWSIRPGDVLRYDAMSRSLQIMNKNPDREAKATLKAGKKPKTTDVILNVEPHFPIHITGSFDREGSPSSGRERKGIGFRDNNFLFVDDTLLYGYTYSTYFLGNYVYHRIPITNFATTFMYGYSFSKATSKKDYAFVGLSSRSENFSGFVYQDLFKKEEYKGEVYLGLDVKDKTVKQITGTTGRDRLRILRIGGNFIHRGFGGVTNFSPEISQGVNAFGANRKSRLSSRTSTGKDNGAENTFTKFNLDLTHKRPLPWNLQGSLQLKGQFATEKMASQEEFSLGGIDSVRGYASGDFSADDAYQSRLEVQIPAFFVPEDWKLPYDARPLRDNITGVTFFDYAYGKRKGEDPNPANKDEVYFASLGAGIRIRLYQQALIRLEWGFVMPGATQGITETSNSRFHFSVSFEDKIYDEMLRVKKIMNENSLKKTSQSLVDAELSRKKSPLRENLYEYMQLAEAAQAKGNLDEAKKYYEKVTRTIKSLSDQAREYVSGSIDQEKKLKTDNDLAMQFYKSGKVQKAKEIWQKIKEEAKIRPLAFELP